MGTLAISGSGTGEGTSLAPFPNADTHDRGDTNASEEQARQAHQILFSLFFYAVKLAAKNNHTTLNEG
jgi:hypothetical protein